MRVDWKTKGRLGQWFRGFPIASSYKYLGLQVDDKLSLQVETKAM